MGAFNQEKALVTFSVLVNSKRPLHSLLPVPAPVPASGARPRHVVTREYDRSLGLGPGAGIGWLTPGRVRCQDWELQISA